VDVLSAICFIVSDEEGNLRIPSDVGAVGMQRSEEAA
jgi:DNA integrity scanning protein DisA with diadenylate cyclase activity